MTVSPSAAPKISIGVRPASPPRPPHGPDHPLAWSSRSMLYAPSHRHNSRGISTSIIANNLLPPPSAEPTECRGCHACKILEPAAASCFNDFALRIAVKSADSDDDRFRDAGADPRGGAARHRLCRRLD